MSERYRRLIEDIADISSELPNVLDLPGERSRLLSALSRFLGVAQNPVILLWLIDISRNEQLITLWSMSDNVPLKTFLDQSPVRIRQRAFPWPEHLFRDRNYDEIAEMYGVSINQGTIDFILHSCPLSGNDLSQSIFPIFENIPGSPQRNPVRLIHVIYPKDSLAIDLRDLNSVKLFTSATKIMGSRLAHARRYRITEAIREFQEAVSTSADSAVGIITPSAACRAVADILNKYAHGSECAVFMEDADGSLCQVYSTNPNTEKKPSNATLIHWAFARSGEESDRLVRITNVFDAQEREQISPQIPEPTQADISGYKGHATLSWLSYVIRVKDHRGHPNKVPLALIRLLTVPRGAFLGGSFTTTDQAILRRLGRYLGDILPDLLLRHTLDQLTQGSTYETIRERLTHSEFLAKESYFGKQITENIPCVKECVIVSQVRSDGQLSNRYRDINGRPLTGITRRFVWGRDAVGEGYADLDCYHLGELGYGFRLLLTRSTLAEHEWIAINVIVSSLRVAALADSSVRANLIQIAEIRHALRGGLASALLHLDATLQGYQLAQDQFKQGRVDSAVRTLLRQAEFRKHMERAELASQTIWTFFENTRILLMDMTSANLQKSSCNIADLIARLRTLFLPECVRRHVILEAFGADRGTSMPNVVCDQNLVTLCLFNLIENAIKYSFRDQTVKITFLHSSENWSIAVEDTGSYIPPEIREAIFRPFIRIPPTRGLQAMPGTGLGLAAVKKIVELHGGKVELDSVITNELNATAVTSFRVIFPRA